MRVQYLGKKGELTAQPKA
ncbi:hypothetical protein P4S64_18645 [Vibrio sp. M60_M31a]